MEIVVRNAILGDETSIAEVHVAAWQAAYREFMSTEFLNSLTIEKRRDMWETALKQPGKGKYIVAEIQNRIQGFAVFGPARDDDLDDFACELVALNVHPNHWRQKIGTTLIRSVFDSSSQENYESVHLWVIEGNLPAIRLYERFGFKNTGKSKTDSSHSGNPIHEIRYSTSLG
jgi:RimJ/RimL family protein N-acetyltransferase